MREANGVWLDPKKITQVPARIAGDKPEMDRAAARILRSVKAVAMRHRATGAYINALSVENVPGLQGRGRYVRDRLVAASDPAAGPIEWGFVVRHPGSRRVTYVPGQHPMKNGLAMIPTVKVEV